MTTYPKLNKADRLAEKQKQKDDLKEYRRIQSSLVIDRDKDLCIFCYFLNHKEVKREDIHHVYGRARKAYDWREKFTSLACTCRKHHPLPLQTVGGNQSLLWVEEALWQANRTPINKNFNVNVLSLLGEDD